MSPSRRSPAVRRCPLAVFRRPDVGGRSVRFLAGEGVARRPFVVAPVARLPSVALWRRGWPSVVFFCRCRLVVRLVSKSRLRARFRACLTVSPCRRVALTLGGVAFPYFGACVWGRIYLNPPAWLFSALIVSSLCPYSVQPSYSVIPCLTIVSK